VRKGQGQNQVTGTNRHQPGEGGVWREEDSHTTTTIRRKRERTPPTKQGAGIFPKEPIEWAVPTPTKQIYRPIRGGDTNTSIQGSRLFWGAKQMPHCLTRGVKKMTSRRSKDWLPPHSSGKTTTKNYRREQNHVTFCRGMGTDPQGVRV